MLLKTLKCVVVLACGVLALTAASAGDKKEAKDKTALSGVWVVKGGELKIEFSGKDMMKVFPHGENEVIIVVCQYTVDQKGMVKAKITDLDGTKKEQAKDKVPVGSEFSFKWTVKDNTATLEDLKGEKVEVLKAHLEGEYEKK